jgi:hypothetical protein
MLEGLTVTAAEAVHDYFQLAFGDEIGLSIYNEMTITPPAFPFEQLVGKVVISTTESTDAIEIEFSDGLRVLIDLRSQAYRGPEALQLDRVGFPIVIWN